MKRKQVEPLKPPVGVRAKITMEFWLPGLTYMQARETLRRVIKLQSQPGDWFVQIGGTAESYTAVDISTAERLALPMPPKDTKEEQA